MSTLLLSLTRENPLPGLAVASLNLVVALSLVGLSLLLGATISLLAWMQALVDRGWCRSGGQPSGGPIMTPALLLTRDCIIYWSTSGSRPLNAPSTRSNRSSCGEGSIWKRSNSARCVPAGANCCEQEIRLVDAFARLGRFRNSAAGLFSVGGRALFALICVAGWLMPRSPPSTSIKPDFEPVIRIHSGLKGPDLVVIDTNQPIAKMPAGPME